jgi:hypothetical protein
MRGGRLLLRGLERRLHLLGQHALVRTELGGLERGRHGRLVRRIVRLRLSAELHLLELRRVCRSALR